jgi:hypothetical protein
MKTDNHREFLKEILNNRGSLIELIAAAILIGFGVEFLASSIYSHFDFNHKNLFFFSAGLILCCLGFIYFLNRFFGKKTFSKELNGFFLLSREKKGIVSIDCYDFADKLSRYLDYAFAEDAGLKKTWNNIDFNRNTGKDNYNTFLKIANEAAEYYLLEKLSNHLSEYFNNSGLDKNELVEYERNDIADILLKNRFLELFSKPMEHRAPFIPDKPIINSKDKSVGKIVASFSKGAMYNHFQLTLPKNSIINRNSDDSISVITQRFTLRLKSITSGLNTYIPWDFYKHYLGLTETINTSAFVVTYKIEVTFHFGSLFRTVGWQYYNWVDSFMIELQKKFEKDYFFDSKIEWDKACVIIKSIKNDKAV